MKKKLSLKVIVMLVVVVIVAIAFAEVKGIHTNAEQSISAPSQDPKILDEIRNRPNIRKQQELIVQETYFIEEKGKVQTEKDSAISKFDNQISVIEKQLEEVRSQKLSFQ